jgi:hypothetical protein
VKRTFGSICPKRSITLEAEVGTAGGPDGAKAGRRQHRRHCLDTVRQEAGHPVAGLHAGLAQEPGEAGCQPVKLGVGETGGDLSPLAHGDQGGLLVATAQQVLGKVETSAAKPGRPGHDRILQHHIEGP